MTPDDLVLLRTPGTPTLSPDGTTAVVSVTHPDLESDEYVGHLWQVPTDGSAAPRPLTRGHRDTAPVWSPDGRWLAFLRAEPKGKPQLHVVEASGGEPVRLTEAPLGVGEARWAPDGQRLVYVARVPEEGRYLPDSDPGAEPPRHITTYQYRGDGVGFTRDKPRHLFLVGLPDLDATPAALPASQQLTEGEHEVAEPRWLPDGRIVAISARHAEREGDLRADAVLVDPEAGAPTVPVPLTDADAGSTLGVSTVAAGVGAVWLLAQDYGPTGRAFVAAQTALYRVDLPAGAVRPTGVHRLTDPETVDLAPGVLAVTADEVLVADQRRGDVVLLGVPVDGGAARVLLPGVVSGVAAGSGVVVATVAGPATAGELVAVGDAGTRTLSDFSAGLRGRVRVPHELTGSAPDGYPVHGWLTLPDAEEHGPGPYPVLLMIHGGPFAQYTSAVFDEVQVAVGAGYAVVHGNPRGSAGYGAAHGRAIRGGFGTVDTDDVLALLDAALADRSRGAALDPHSVGVMGGSYGGYLTAWLTTRTDRFAGAIVERGFLDPVSFVGSSDIGWFFGLEYLGDPGDDGGAQAVAAQSPMAHVGRVRTPTLVIHSEQDWRCPVEQGQRWFVELKRRGVPAELLLFPGEGHELTRSGRPRHRKARFDHVLRWWAERLA